MRKLFIYILALSLVASVAACKKKDDAEAKTDGADASTAKADSGAAAAKGEVKIEKLIFAFQPQENPEGLQPDAKKLAKFVEEQTGIETKIFLPTTYAAVVEALRAGNAQVAYFSGWPYLVAHDKADVELLVVEERDGNPFYHSQWYVSADSKIEKLADLKGKKIAYTSPTSTSGYLFPTAKLVEEGVLEKGGDPKTFFGEVVFAGGYEAALKSLVNGKVDAAAASDYAPGIYLNEEERKKIKVLSKQGPVPTHGIAIKADVPDDVKKKVKAAFLALNKEENKELLKSVYGAESLVARSHDDHVAGLKKAREAVGADYPLK